MLDTIHTDYSYEILKKDGVSHIRVEGLCPIYEGLKGDPGMLESLRWSSDEKGLLIHYLVKGELYEGFPRSLITDLREGRAKLEVVCLNDVDLHVIPRRL